MLTNQQRGEKVGGGKGKERQAGRKRKGGGGEKQHRQTQ